MPYSNSGNAKKPAIQSVLNTPVGQTPCIAGFLNRQNKRIDHSNVSLLWSIHGESAKELLQEFYNSSLPSKKVVKKRTVRDAIGDLPKMYPLSTPIRVNGKQYSHSFAKTGKYANHVTRYNSTREIEIFKLLTDDIQNGLFKYISAESLKKLYTQKTGKESNIHKYHVLRWDEPSNTIPAHLYKDGLRHIHPDPEQARSISVREAARLQTFPDDYHFITGTALDFKMIGNAVPPLFAKLLANSIYELLFKEKDN